MDWLAYGLIGWAAGDLIGGIAKIVAGEDNPGGRLLVVGVLVAIWFYLILGLHIFKGVTL